MGRLRRFGAASSTRPSITRLAPLPALCLIIVVAVLLRVGVALLYGDATTPGQDENSYSVLAARLASGYGYSFPEAWYPFAPAETPTAHWSFLYTAFVAGIYRIFGMHPLVVRLAGALLTGILLPWLLYRLTWRALGYAALPAAGIGRGQTATVALTAAALGACYAYFVLYGAMVMTEGLYICALLWSLERALALEQTLRADGEMGGAARRAFIALGLTLGLSLGIAALLRQAILPWVALLLFYLVWAGYRSRRLGAAVGTSILACVVMAACILPFTLRNYRVYGEFLLLNSNTGFAMYSAQHPMHGTEFREYVAAPLPTDLDPMPANEAQWERALLRRGFGFIAADPVRYARLSLSRVADYFIFWPAPETSPLHNLGRTLSFGLLLPCMLYGLWLSRHAWRRLRLLYLFMLCYSLLHILTWAMSRYRLPVDAVLLLFAALALVELWGRLRRRLPQAVPEGLPQGEDARTALATTHACYERVAAKVQA